MKLAIHLGLQLALFAALRAIVVALRDPGTAITPIDNDLRNFLTHNLIQFWESSAWTSYPELLVVLVVVVLLARKFHEKPIFLRRTALTGIPFFAAYLYGSLWGEVRVFLEVYSIGFLIAFQNLAELLGYEMEAEEEGSSYLTLHVLMLTLGALLLSVTVVSVTKYSG